MHHQPLHPVTSPEMTVSNPGGPLTVASAIPMVESWTDLSPTRRRDLISALKATAHIAALPLSNVPLTPDFLRRHVLGVSAAQYGVSTSRLSNIRALLRFVLRRADVIDAADTPVTPAWSVLLDCLGTQQRHGLIGFARFCSGRGLAPSMVSSVTLEDFLTHLLERTLTHHPRERVACVRNVWNQAYATLEGWPPHQLTLLHQPTPFIKPITAFPESFQTDLTAFRDRMAATVLDRPDDEIADEGDLSTLLIRPKPVRASTAQQRMSHARSAASALVKSGQFPTLVIKGNAPSPADMTGIAVRKSDADLLRWANVFIWNQVRTGRYQELFQTYFGNDTAPPTLGFPGVNY